MLKQIALGVVLLAGLLTGTAWADEALNKALLFNAVGNCDWAKVEALISKGADVNAKDSDGKTPLDRAGRNELHAVLQKREDMEMVMILQTALQNQTGNQREAFNRIMANYNGRAMVG